MQYLEWKETITFNRLIKFIDHIFFFHRKYVSNQIEKWNARNTDIYNISILYFQGCLGVVYESLDFTYVFWMLIFSFTAHDASLSSNHTQTCTKKMFRINIMLDKRRENIISKSKVQFITRIVWCAWYNFHDRNIKGT